MVKIFSSVDFSSFSLLNIFHSLHPAPKIYSKWNMRRGSFATAVKPSLELLYGERKFYSSVMKNSPNPLTDGDTMN